MSHKVLIAPSILSADFAKLSEAAILMQHAGADWLHVDVMDGHFVPNITVGPVVVKSLKKYTTLPLDVHLMITDPIKYGKAFANAGAWGLTFHIEAVSNPQEVIRMYKELGVRIGISIKPKTSIDTVFPYLSELHHVLIMTVEPGFGGQSFMADMLPKIVALRKRIDETNSSCLIEVDGGIDLVTGPVSVKSGANVLVAGNAIFNTPDPVAALSRLKSALLS